MSLYVLSDTHLATADANKSMEAFGSRWQNYIDRIERNWRALIGAEDTVVIPGDISWGMTLEEALRDFQFLQRLPGQKLLGKGNHDFWWTTSTKMYRFFEENELDSLHLLYNNAYTADGVIVCGTRGWFVDPSLQKTVGEVDHAKIVNRELIRLRMSLDAAQALRTDHNEEIIPFLHFPPIWGSFRCDEMVSVLREYGVHRCYFGHIHGNYDIPRTQEIDGISLFLVSADHLNFTPLRIFA